MWSPVDVLPRPRPSAPLVHRLLVSSPAPLAGAADADAELMSDASDGSAGLLAGLRVVSGGLDIFISVTKQLK